MILFLTHLAAFGSGALALYAIVQPKLARLAALTDRDALGRFTKQERDD